MEAPVSYKLTNDVWMIPCKIEPNRKSFKPLIKPFGKSTALAAHKRRKYWTKEEDQTITEIIKKSGPHYWSSVAKELNIKFHNCFNLRNGKQCRERWLSTLDPNLLKSKWTKQEDCLLQIKQKELGNKWSLIKGFLEGRSESQVKNRWKTLRNRKNVKVEKGNFDRKRKFEVGDREVSEYSLEDIEGYGKENGFWDFELGSFEGGRFDLDFRDLEENIEELFFFTGEDSKVFLSENERISEN